MVYTWTEDLGVESLPHVKRIRCLGILFTCDSKMERDMDRRIGAALGITRMLY